MSQSLPVDRENLELEDKHSHDGNEHSDHLTLTQKTSMSDINEEKMNALDKPNDTPSDAIIDDSDPCYRQSSPAENTSSSSDIDEDPDNEPHPRKKIALPPDTQRKSRTDKRTVTSSSEEDEDNASDEPDDDSDERDLPPRRRHSQSIPMNTRRRIEDDQPIDVEEIYRELRESVSPKSVNKLVGFADSLLSALTKRGSWDGNRDAATTFIKEWLPKYAQALLNRGYTDVSPAHMLQTGRSIHNFFNKILEIYIRILLKFEYAGVEDGEFHLSDEMHDAVYRILGDDHAPFYRRFDGRYEAVRGIGALEYEDNTNDIINADPMEHRMSQYQIESINHFTRASGLQAILCGLGCSQSEPSLKKVELKDMYYLIRVIHRIGNFAVTNFGSNDYRECVFKIACCVQKQILKIPDELFNRLDRKTLINVIQMVHSMVISLPSTVTGITRDVNRTYEGMVTSDEEDDDNEFISYHEIPDGKQILVTSFMRLEIANRLLKCFILDLRLAGLNIIKDVLNYGYKQAKILKRSRRKESLSIETDEETVLVETENISDWIIRRLTEKLRKDGILEYIYGPNIHLEIVQRSTEIIVFLINAEALTSVELDVIWSPVEGNQHRSIVHGVCHVLHEIADILTLENKSYLFKKIRLMPMSFIESQTFSLIKALVVSLIDHTPPLRSSPAIHDVLFEALLLLWHILRDSSLPLPILINSELLSPKPTSVASSTTTIDQDLIQGVAHLLNTILQRGLMQEQRDQLLLMCIEDVKNHNPGTVWALRVILRIFSTSLSSSYTAAEYYRQLANLTDLFLSDLTHWTSAIKSLTDRHGYGSSMEIDQMSPSSGQQSPTANLSPARVTILKDQLQGRLQFLQWMANADLVNFFTSIDQTDIVWDCLIADPIGRSERDEAFACLESISNYELFHYHFFHDRLPQLDVRYFSENALKYAKTCLVKVNAKNDRIRMTYTPQPQNIYVCDELIGIELIWNIALNAEDEAVGKEAVAFLVHLYMNTDLLLDNYIEIARQNREALVDKCVAHLFDSANGLSSPSTLTRMTGIDPPSSNPCEVSADNALSPMSYYKKEKDALAFKRCLELLKYFMDYFDVKYHPSEIDRKNRKRHGMLNDGELITIKINNNGPGASQMFDLQIHTSDTVFALRQKVAARLGVSRPSLVRLFVLGKELVMDADRTTLKEQKITDLATFIASRRQSDIRGIHNTDVGERTFENEITESDLPINLLSKYVDKFFELLQIEELYASQIWDLLMRLPTNERMLETLKMMETPVQWSNLFDSRSPFRLLYALQIVDWLLRGGDETVDADEWCTRFLDNGGLDYLLSVLILRDPSDSEPDGHEDSMSVKKRACLGLLLKVIDFFASNGSPASGEAFKRINKADLVAKMIEIVGKCTDQSHEQVEEDVFIIKHATKLLLCLCLNDENALNSFLKYPNLRQWLLSALAQCQSEESRQEIARMIYRFCVMNTEPMIDENTDQRLRAHEFFIRLLISFLPELENHVFSSKEYFDLCGDLLGLFTKTTDYNVKELFIELVNRLRQHPIREQSHVCSDDTVVVGLLKLIKILVEKYSELKRIPELDNSLIDMIFHDCLFEIPVMKHSGSTCLPPKCKLDLSRNTAMELLYELAKDCPENFSYLTELLLQQLDRGNQLNNQWNYCPKASQKAVSGYVGLQNLGATCYINSIVQQFFMNSSFRDGIFMAPVKDENKDESLLYQLQVVFGHLQESAKKAYEATPFCRAYKDYDGQPLNVAVQMDVDEYFAGLFDRLENSVTGTPQAVLFKEHFGGTTVQQIKSRECTHVSEREDTFFVIQCEVKNKRSVEESLQLYVEGEILDGDNKYSCTKCGVHVDAIKRTCFKKLPNNLIIHLKRFDFDYEASKRIKINDFFEFPTEINMEPYTLDYLTKKESGQLDELNMDTSNMSQYEYELVGVLVHTGTADSGHYYSFIKERKPAPGDPSTERRWYQFNDSNVELFDAREIPKQCYGGPEQITQWDPNLGKSVTRTFPRPYSAYMLFYERCSDTSNDIMSPAAKDHASNVPSDIYTHVWDENIGFLKDRNIFDTAYFRLLWNVLHSIDAHTIDQLTSPEKDVDFTFRIIQISSEFVLGILSRSKDNMDLKNWTEFLRGLFRTHFQGCHWFISRFISSPNYMQQILMSCYIQDVRELIVELVTFALSTLREGDASLYGLEKVGITGEEGRELSMNIDTREVQNSKGLIYQLLDAAYALLPNAYIWWRNFDQFFYLLSFIANLGVEEKVYMINTGFVGELVKVFLADEIALIKGRKRRMFDKFTYPPFRHLLGVLRSLLYTCDLSKISDNEVDELGNANGIHGSIRLSSEEYQLFTMRLEDETMIFFIKQIREGIDPTVTRDIFSYFCNNNYPFFQELVTQLCHAASNYHLETIKPYLEHIFYLCLMNDGLPHKRVQFAVQEVLKLSKTYNNFPNCCECFHFIEAICESHVGPIAQRFLELYLSEWVPTFLLYNMYDVVRQKAESLCDIVIFKKLDEVRDEQDMQEAEESVKKLYCLLLDMMENAEACWKSLSRRKELEVCGWRLSSYFRVLTKCVRSPNEQLMFARYFDRFVSCYRALDFARIDCDMDKKELIIFWHKVCEGCPTNIELLNASILESLFMYYVSINHSRENILYNQETLPKYYGILLMACKQMPEVHEAWMEAPNFLWALSSMVFGDFYQEHKTDELLELLKISADISPEFRMKCWKAVLNNFNHPNCAPLNRKITTVLKLHQLLYRDTVDDLRIFSENQGFDTLSRIRGEENLTRRLENLLRDDIFLQCLNVIHMYLRLAVRASDEVSKSSLESWSERKNFARLLIHFLHPGVDHDTYIRVINILCYMLKIPSTRDICTEILQPLIDSHLDWQKKAVQASPEADLHIYFGGPRSPFLPLLGVPGRNGPSLSTNARIHVYRPFLQKLSSDEVKRLEEELYKPYADVIIRTATAGVEMEEYDRAVQLCSLVALETFDLDTGIVFTMLLDLYNNSSENVRLQGAYEHTSVAMLIERVLNSDEPRIVLNLNSEKLNAFKSLTDIIKKSKADVIQPIVSKRIQQLAADVKVLKETIGADDMASIVPVVQQLIVILQILSITLSDDDLTPDDPLTQAYLVSLGDLEGEDVRNGLGRFDDLASVTKQLGQLVIGLKPKKGQEMDNGESEIDVEIVSGVGDGNNDGNGSQMEVNTNEGAVMTSGVTGDVGNNDNTEA